MLFSHLQANAKAFVVVFKHVVLNLEEQWDVAENIYATVEDAQLDPKYKFGKVVPVRLTGNIAYRNRQIFGYRIIEVIDEPNH